MANDYKIAIEEVKVQIGEITKAVKTLDEATLHLSESIRKTAKEAKTPADVSGQLKKQEKLIESLNSKIDKQGEAIKKLNGERKKEKTLLTEQEKLQKKLERSTQNLVNSRTKEHAQTIKNRKALTDYNRSLRKGAGDQAALTVRVKAFFKTLVAFDLARRLVDSFFMSMKKGFNNLKSLDSIRLQFQYIVNDIKETADTMMFLTRISGAYGAEIINMSERYIKFRAASLQSNLSMKDTQKIFESVTKAAGVLGLKTHELQGIYLALEQMLSKGKVTTEELRRQLGERLPGAMDIMAKSIGVTTRELDAMMKKGQIISKEVLPKFAEELERAYGIENVRRVTTLVASQTRLTNSWKLFIAEIEKGSGVISKTFMGALDLASRLALKLNENAKAQTKLNKVNVSKGWLDYLKKVSIFTTFLKTDYNELIGLQKDLNKEAMGFDGTNLSMLLDLHVAYGKKIAESTGKTREMYIEQARLITQSIGAKATETQSLRDQALALGWSGQIWDSINDKIINVGVSIDKVTNEDLRKYIDMMKAADDGTSKFAKDSIGWLEEQIKLNGELIKSTTDQSVRDAMREKNKILKERIDLLTKGKEEEAKVLELYKSGIIPELKKEIDLIDDKISKTRDLNEVGRLEKVKKALSEVISLARKGDITSIFNIEDLPEGVWDDMINEMQVVNPLFKEYIEYLRDIDDGLKNLKPTLLETKKDFKDWIVDNSEALVNMGMLISDTFNSLGDVVQNRIDKIEDEKDALNERYDLQKELIENEIGDEASKQERLRQLDNQNRRDEEKINKRIQKEKEKQLKYDKAAALIRIGINTAVGITQAWVNPGYPLAIGLTVLLAALGIAQTVAVQGESVPAYKHGGKHKGGKAIVGDGGRHEAAVLPSGEVWRTPRKDTLVDLPSGTQIYPDFDKFQSDNDKMREMAWAYSIDYNFTKQARNKDTFAKDLRKDVMKSLSGLTINNHSHEVAQAVKQAIADSNYTSRFL